MLTANPILDLLTAALPGVDLADVARAYAAVVPHLKAPKRARKAGGIAEPIDTATLGDAALFAHYKKTAPYADLSFFVAHCEHVEIRSAAGDLLRDSFDEAGSLRIARPEFYRQLRNLQDRWRRETAPWNPAVKRRELRMRILENISASEAARARSRFAAVA